MRTPRAKAVATVIIDAAGRSLGRVCSEAAVALRGKGLSTFAPNKLPKVDVIIKNIDNLRFTGSKLNVKKYNKFSGYPGGLKVTTLMQELEKNPERLVRRSVEHMLPKNRLASRLLLRLTVYRGEAK